MSEGPHPARPDGPTDEGFRSARAARPPMPRWVKVLLVIVLVLVAALLVSRALGMEHGPGMHGAIAHTTSTVIPVASSPTS